MGQSDSRILTKRVIATLKRTFSKNNFVDKKQASIAQQLDIKTNEQSYQATSSIKEAKTTENNMRYKEMQSDKTAYLRDNKTES